MLYDDEPWHYSTINLTVWRTSEGYEIFNPFRVHPSSDQGTSHVHHLRGNAEDESRIIHFMRFHLENWVDQRVVLDLENRQRCRAYERWNTVEQKIVLIKPTDHKLLWIAVILLCLKVLHNYWKRQKTLWNDWELYFFLRRVWNTNMSSTNVWRVLISATRATLPRRSM